MKIINLATTLAALVLFANTVYAEVALQSKEALVGSWKLLQTKAGGGTKEAMERQDTWIFKDGKVTILHIPREGTFYDQPPVDYVVEDGKLKVAILGRADKFESFSVLSMDDKRMVLVGKFDTHYEFMKK